MYTVSDEYKIKMLDQIQTHALSGTIGSSPFSGEDVIGVSYTNKCTEKKVSVGSVNIGVLKLTFLKNLLDRGDYLGKEIDISDGLLINNSDPLNPVYEDIPVGVFYIGEAVWTAADMINVTAYDCLSKLDTPISLDQTTGSVYSFCSYIALQTGTTFGMTEQECLLLPNGGEIISPYEENNMETWRDLLSAIATFIGGFAYADRDGSWKLKIFGTDPVITIPKRRRMNGSKFSDFESAFDTISFVDIQSETLKVYGDGLKLTMSLGMNPFLQYGTVGAVSRRAENILGAVKNIKYTPYDVSGLPAFIALDLGDVVAFSDDYAGDTSYGAVMNFVWTYNKSMKIQCFGENPNLRKAQSKNDKDISGLINNSTKNEITYFNFANIGELTILPEEEVSIAELRFTSSQQTTVKIMHEFIFDMLADLAEAGSYELHYYLDDELLPYKPYERIGGLQGATAGETELSICKDFFYILRDVEPNIRHKWEVKILTHGISETTIGVDHAHITVEGQRLYGEDFFDGFIEAEDNLTLIPFGYLALKNITDTVNVDVGIPNEAIQVTDQITMYSFSSMQIKPMTESVQIFMEGGFYIATEDGKYLTTEDDVRMITEE